MYARAFTTVHFHGIPLLGIRGATPGETLIAMKPVVVGMGLGWPNQYKKILSHPMLSKGVVLITMPSPGGPQEMVFLPLNRLHFWLSIFQPNRIPDPRTRAQVILFQEECADALFMHFFGRKADEDAGAVPLTEKQVADLLAAALGAFNERCFKPFARSMGARVDRVEERLVRVEAAAIDLAVAHDRRRVTVDRVSALDLCRGTAEQKGRDDLVKRITFGLKRRLKAMGLEPEKCANSGTNLYPRDLGLQFMREVGDAMVADHNAHQRGLQPLPLNLRPQGRRRYKGD